MSDEPTPELRELAARLFAAGRAERPSPALGRRLLLIEPLRSRPAERALHEHLASPEGQRVVAQPSRVALWLTAAAVLGTGAAVWQMYRPDEREISISPERVPSRSVAPSFEPGVVVSGPLAGIDASGEAKTGETTPPKGRPRIAARAQVGSPPVAPRDGVSPDDAARGASPNGATARQAAPRRRRVVDSVTPASAAPSASGAQAQPDVVKPVTLRDELELLTRARDLLRSGNAARALELIERHGRERAGSGLDAEATLLRVETYAALGRHGEASELATRFVRDNPNSALGDRAKSFIRSTPPRTP